MDVVEIEGFWAYLAAEMETKVTGRQPLTMGVVANGKLGSHTTASVGDAFVDKETLAGKLLHKIAISYNLCIPSTFTECYTGNLSSTWECHESKSHRIYLILPPMAAKRSAETPVLEDESVILSRRDHYPLVAQCEIIPVCEPTYTKRRQPIASRFAMSRNDQVVAFQHSLANCPAVPRHVDSYTHCRVTFDYVRSAMRLCFPLKNDGPKKEWITHTTWTTGPQVYSPAEVSCYRMCQEGIAKSKLVRTCSHP